MQLEDMVAAIEASGQYRILRRLNTDCSQLRPRDLFIEPGLIGTKLGGLLDCETTGTDPRTSEIIELAIVPFSYDGDGNILAIHQPYHRLREPSHPIPEAITQLTGIDDAMVAGQVIDLDELEAFIRPIELCTAHKASFDRKFAEGLSPAFASIAWACSVTQVPWREEGFESRALGYLSLKSGFYFDGHRATDDGVATVEILGRRLPRSGRTALSFLLEAAAQVTARVRAPNTPYERKDLLKARGYRWSDGSDGSPKAWWIDVPENRLNEELAFLKAEIYHRECNIPIRMITARDRFSVRAD
ncbi:3'-5' exonuclease [Microvirga tunisiensis]|uniref:3'-5' exonuclease n=2 Tax=Microvirga tunisiensis TaxID=2108360 RepID=A0A5N7MM16_9HYPH|nr:3'-5' exonuclease [Microvirga tunisiensis]MPR27489.1 3'-5' exonuclease [Microvirga tunisiensis]